MLWSSASALWPWIVPQDAGSLQGDSVRPKSGRTLPLIPEGRRRMLFVLASCYHLRLGDL
jgi:hypothetical protein